MRLIDADALKQFEISFLMSDGYGYADVVYAGYIHQAPTIDAVPVKHGEWLPYEWCTDGTWDKCSVCGVAHRARHKYTGFVDHKVHVFQEQLNYCPNCGAKMDGGKDDDIKE